MTDTQIKYRRNREKALVELEFLDGTIFPMGYMGFLMKSVLCFNEFKMSFYYVEPEKY